MKKFSFCPMLVINRLRLFIVYLVMLNITSCNQQPVKSDDIINIDLTENNSSDRTYKYSDFFSSFSYFPIPNDDIVIGRISKLIQTENFVYVFDKTGSKAIYCLNKNGQLVFRINAMGKGPGEYIALSDISVCNNILYVYDFSQNKIIKYNAENGEFISERIIEFRFDSFYVNDKYTYYLMDPANKIKHWLYIENNLNNSIKKEIPHSLYPNLQIGNSESPFFSYNDTIILCHYYLETIFKIYGDIVEPYIKLNTGRYSIYNRNYSDGLVDNLPRYQKGRDPFYFQVKTITGFLSYFENSRFIYFSYRNNKIPKTLIFDKVTKLQTIQNIFKNDIAHIGAQLYASPIEKQAISFINSDQTYWIKELGFEKERDLSVDKSVFEKLDVESNPVIITFYEKE